MKVNLRSLSFFLLLLIVASAVFAIANVSGTSSSGPIFWKTWGGKGDDIGNGVAVDPSGNIYVTGSTNSFTSGSRLFLLKFDPVGNLLWQKLWNGSTGGQNIKIDSSGNIYLAGINAGAFLLKINGNSDILWQEKWGNSSIVNEALALGTAGDIYMTGTLYHNYTFSHIFLVKFDSAGTALWQKTWGGNCTSDGQGAAVDATDEVYVTGFTDSFLTYSPSGMRYCQQSGGGIVYQGVLLKFNSTGNLEWQRIWGAQGTPGIATDSAGNVYLTGASICNDFGGPYAAFAKFNSSGNLLWEGTWTITPLQDHYSCPYDSITSLAVDSSGNSYTTGTDGYGVLLNKLDTNGNLLSAYSWGSSSSLYRGVGNDIALDHFGTPILTGYIGAQPYQYWTQIKGPEACNCKLYSTTTPSGILANITLPLTSSDGSIMDVKGSTTYAGGSDVLLNYGSRLPVPTFNPFIAPLLLGFVIIAIRGLAGRDKPKLPRRRISISGSRVNRQST